MVRTRCGVGLLAAFIVACFSNGHALAAETVVRLHDGRSFTGELVREDANNVVLAISGIQTTIARKDIAFVETRQSIEEQYRQKRSELAQDDVPGRIALVQWLVDQRAFALADHEVRDLQRVAPQHERLRSLAATVNAALDLERQARAPAPGPRPAAQAGPDGAPGAAPARQREEMPLLDEKQVTLIKVWELPANLRDTPVRIAVPRPVIEEVFDKFREDSAIPRGVNAQRNFFQRSGPQQLEWLFDLATRNPGVREYYDDVTIAGDPPVLLEFRRGMYRDYVQRYFARHFAQGQVPGLVLPINERNATAELYTNFYILTQTRVDDQPLINRNNPRQSLLLQWGLPRAAATYPAPDVPGWRPFFNGPNDPNLERFARWIESLYPTARDYGVQYVPPGGEFNIRLKPEPPGSAGNTGTPGNPANPGNTATPGNANRGPAGTPADNGNNQPRSGRASPPAR